MALLPKQSYSEARNRFSDIPCSLCSRQHKLAMSATVELPDLPFNSSSANLSWKAMRHCSRGAPDDPSCSTTTYHTKSCDTMFITSSFPVSAEAAAAAAGATTSAVVRLRLACRDEQIRFTARQLS